MTDLKMKYFILKKEFKDFILSYKSILMLLLASIFPVFVRNEGPEDFPIWIQVLFIQMVIGQYMYDSYLLDIKRGGIKFILNIKVSFNIYFFYKLIFSSLVTLIPLFVNIHNIEEYLSLLDLIWIILSFVYCGCLMFIGVCFSKGEEIATSVIITIILSLVLFGLSKVMVASRVLFVIIIDTLFIFVCSKLFKSLYLRKQL